VLESAITYVDVGSFKDDRHVVVERLFRSDDVEVNDAKRALRRLRRKVSIGVFDVAHQRNFVEKILDELEWSRIGRVPVVLLSKAT